MFTAKLDIISYGPIDVIKFFILFFEVVDLLIAFINLANSHSVGVLGLVQDFGEIVVSHNLSLSCLMIVQGLRFVFI